MPKAKPVSLHPLSFDEALKALIGVSPKQSETKRKQSKKKKQKSK
jgi:hypothetical protein